MVLTIGVEVFRERRGRFFFKAKRKCDRWSNSHRVQLLFLYLLTTSSLGWLIRPAVQDSCVFPKSCMLSAGCCLIICKAGRGEWFSKSLSALEDVPWLPLVTQWPWSKSGLPDSRRFQPQQQFPATGKMWGSATTFKAKILKTNKSMGFQPSDRHYLGYT